jgi:hypothetical protein
MAYFAGFDVSVKETRVCIVDDAGKIVRERGWRVNLKLSCRCHHLSLPPVWRRAAALPQPPQKSATAPIQLKDTFCWRDSSSSRRDQTANVRTRRSEAYD